MLGLQTGKKGKGQEKGSWLLGEYWLTVNAEQIGQGSRWIQNLSSLGTRWIWDQCIFKNQDRQGEGRMQFTDRKSMLRGETLDHSLEMNDAEFKDRHAKTRNARTHCTWRLNKAPNVRRNHCPQFQTPKPRTDFVSTKCPQSQPPSSSCPPRLSASLKATALLAPAQTPRCFLVRP